MGDFVISKAGFDDAEGILHVQQTAWVCTYPNTQLGITKEDVAEKAGGFVAERWRKNISETGTNSEIFVAKNGERVIGFSGVMHEENQDRITAVYVDPAHHKKGVGTALMQSALDWIGSSKKPIVIEVVAYNEGAIRFYEKFGFKKHRDYQADHAKLPSGKMMPEIEMIKKFT